MSTIVKADANGAVLLPADLCRAAGVSPGLRSGRRCSRRPDRRRPEAETDLGADRGVGRRRSARRVWPSCPPTGRRNMTITSTAPRNGRSSCRCPGRCSRTRSIGSPSLIRATHFTPRPIRSATRSARSACSRPMTCSTKCWPSSPGWDRLGRASRGRYRSRCLARSRHRSAPPTRADFIAALALYEARPDKGYSLTDCRSMLAMRGQGISEVLTSDRHFSQEGFTVLFPTP